MKFRLIIIITAMLATLAVLLFSCKARNVDHQYSASSLKTDNHSKILTTESLITNINSKNRIQESKKDSFGFEFITITEYFEPSDLIPPNTKKSESTSIKNFGNKESKNSFEKDFNLDHSELKNIDSLGVNKSEFKEKEKIKVTKSKSNIITFWIGSALFLIIVGIGIYIWWRFRK
jgi:flagellar basal body-associated protein FliL